LGYATGAVLSQLCDDSKWHPVGFMSKGIDVAERNYEVLDKELLSVIRGLEEWRHISEGTRCLEYWTNSNSVFWKKHSIL